jgi:hypothetical protein
MFSVFVAERCRGRSIKLDSHGDHGDSVWIFEATQADWGKERHDSDGEARKTT